MDAYDLMIGQRYAEAIREYRKLFERNPDDWAAVGRGAEHLSHGRGRVCRSSAFARPP